MPESVVNPVEELANIDKQTDKNLILRTNPQNLLQMKIPPTPSRSLSLQEWIKGKPVPLLIWQQK